ncbi:MAG TPA: SagB/ThcOx family dehydrogenase [candidate division Zixibacteria bacterium]|nr:SagB/ThcOx family dehydrogenase [candidate division Zixibacteria bacterium]
MKNLTGILIVILSTGLLAQEIRQLPPPREDLEFDLAGAMQLRRTIRSYTDEPIPEENLATILWAAYGVNRDNGKKTVPVATGADYLRIFVAMEDGAWRYVPEGHHLELVNPNDIRKDIGVQRFVGTGQFVIVIVTDISAYKLPVNVVISKESKINHGHATAGASAQNIHLACAALDYGTCIIGMIRQNSIIQHLDLGKREIPLYAMPVGVAEIDE